MARSPPSVFDFAAYDWGFLLPKEAPDAGIEPDVRVEPTIYDIASGTDAEMAAVKKLIR